MPGKPPWAAAAIEALEEAGADGKISRNALGRYTYDKEMNDGSVILCEVQVFLLKVAQLRGRWKERDERTRRWFSLPKAAELVAETELSELLLALNESPTRGADILRLSDGFPFYGDSDSEN